MKTVYPSLSLVAVVHLGLPLALLGQALPATTAPRVVVLQNESVIQGEAEPTEDGWLVTNGPWHRVRVPQRDVDFVAADLAAAYRIKLRRISPLAFDEHLRLAQWCLRHDLDGKAGDRLLHLVRLDPHHPAVAALEAQLRRRASPEVVRAGLDLATESVPLSDAADREDELPPLPRDAVGEFTRAIQPLLLNRCGQTTCHGNAARNTFQLSRLAPGKMTRRDLTLRNLRAVLAQIDEHDAERSPLLLQAVSVHGPAQRSSIEPHEVRQYERLVGWVREVAQAEGGLPSHGEPWGVEPAQVSDSAFPSASDSAAAGLASDPVDPLDPAEFNARFAADTPAAEMPTPTTR